MTRFSPLPVKTWLILVSFVVAGILGQEKLDFQLENEMREYYQREGPQLRGRNLVNFYKKKNPINMLEVMLHFNVDCPLSLRQLIN